MARIRLRAAFLLVPVFLAMAALAAAAPPSAARRAVVLDVDGAIGPAMADYIVRAIGAARPAEDGIVVLRMNTPGGLESSMREIIRAILASPVPVATFVAPSGARAASAGTYIAYASAIAAMAPGTNIGAATPVELGGGSLFGGSSQPKQQGKHGEPADTESRKILNDSIAFIRSLAILNGRNADWAADAVRSAVSIPATDALSLHVINLIAGNVPDLLRGIDGKTVTVNGKPFVLHTAGLSEVNVPRGWRTEFLGFVTDPDVAFLLMLVGIYGLIIEFFSPGAVLPGLIGTISLLVALYALALIPINYAGAALVVVGIGLMIAEVHIGAFGALGIGGIAAFVIGALLMFPEQTPGLTLSPGIVVGAAVGSALVLLFVLGSLVRSRRRKVVTGGEALIGAQGETVTWEGEEGRVRVEGEIWRARTAPPGTPLKAGTPVKVIKRDGLVLIVQSL
jgi:membrane-bound serine protease (ClpP class)